MGNVRIKGEKYEKDYYLKCFFRWCSTKLCLNMFLHLFGFFFVSFGIKLSVTNKIKQVLFKFSHRELLREKPKTCLQASTLVGTTRENLIFSP